MNENLFSDIPLLTAGSRINFFFLNVKNLSLNNLGLHLGINIRARVQVINLSEFQVQNFLDFKQDK